MYVCPSTQKQLYWLVNHGLVVDCMGSAALHGRCQAQAVGA